MSNISEILSKVSPLVSSFSALLSGNSETAVSDVEQFGFDDGYFGHIGSAGKFVLLLSSNSPKELPFTVTLIGLNVEQFGQ